MEYNHGNTLLLCPVCNGHLVKYTETKTYRCSENHSYDISKEGYVNLLMCSNKKSKNPGDPKEMVVSRKEFLSKDFYQEVSNKINETLFDSLKTLSMDTFNILDLGCGEGYYLNNLIDFLNDKEIKSNYYGMDISKSAIKYAVKLNKDATWAVGNNYSIPLRDNSVDCVLSVFSPVDMEEINRVLKDNGYFVRVFPELNHLIQLKKIIYPQINLKEYKQYKLDTPELKFIDEVNVTYDVELEKQDLQNLLKMTPHFWRVKKEDKTNLDSYNSIVVTIDVCVGVFKKI